MERWEERGAGGEYECVAVSAARRRRFDTPILRELADGTERLRQKERADAQSVD